MSDTPKLRNEIRDVINRCCAENGSNTPDFMLAEYLLGCLSAYEKTVNSRDEWYGIRFGMCVISENGESK